MHSSSSPPPLLQQVPTTRDPRESPWYPYDNGSGFDANIAMILVFLFCALVCAVALNAAICLFRRRSAHHHLPETAPAAGKPTNGSSLPVASPPSTMVYSAGMKLAGAAAECAICLSEFVNGEGVRVLPRCKHGFHVNCIEGWLSSHTSCPTCRSCSLAPSPERSTSPVPINSETVVHIESSQSETSPTQQEQRSETE